MKFEVRFFRITASALAFALMLACAPKQGSKSTLRIVLPSAQSQKLSQNVNALSFDFSKACFAVNVTGPGIPTTSSACSATIGKFAGFFAQSTTVELEVPQGMDRKVEIYHFLRTNSFDPCPTSMSALLPTQVALIGTTSGIAMNQPEVSVSVTVAAPPGGVNLVTQLGIAPTCSVASGRSAHGISFGMQNSSTVGGYKIRSKVSPLQTSSEVATTSGYKIQMGQKAR